MTGTARDAGRAAPRRAPATWLPAPEPGRAALVTGASSGLGAELARALAGRGHDVVLVARRGERLQDLARELAGSGPTVHAVPCDLTAPDQRASLAAELAGRGLEVSILVNAAGAGAAGDFLGVDRERQVADVRLGLEAAVDLCARFGPAMVARRSGAVLSVCSLFSWTPVPRMAAYAAAKAGLLSFTEALHVELKQHGVAVTALCPGTMPTEFMPRAGLAATVATMPALALDDPRQVAERGLQALARNRRVAAPSMVDRSTTALLRALPRGLLLGVLERWSPFPAAAPSAARS